MELLERDREIELLNSTRAKSADGSGHVVLVSGEAGIGKTALIKHFAKAAPTATRFFWGACDPLFTPQPLAPVHDISRQLSHDKLVDALLSRNRLSIFSTVIDEVQQSNGPTVIVIEDIHWADEATLDLILFLSRRLHETRGMLVVTYRDDELDSEHPLRQVLGHLAGRNVTRLKLSRLSRKAVEHLAKKKGRAAAKDLYALTGGNPFYVTERLASLSDDVPPTIQEVVTTRLSQLTPAAREVLELASMVPRLRIERWLIDTTLNPAADTMAECVSFGLLDSHAEAFVFRHELTRLAVLESLPVSRQMEYHHKILEQLLDAQQQGESVSLAHIVHHARAVHATDIIQRLAPIAAEEAGTIGSHRESAAHYETLLDFTDGLSEQDQAGYLEKLSYEYYLTGQIPKAIEVRQRVLEIRERLGQPEKTGENLRWLSRLVWFAGKTEQAQTYATRAIEVLEALAPGYELAMAYSNQSQLFILTNDAPQAIQVGLKALQLAEEQGFDDLLSHILNNLGVSQWRLGDAEGQENLERSLQLALEHKQHEHAARAYTNIASILAENIRYDEARRYYDEGIRYCVDRDLDSWGIYMRGGRAHLLVETGAWDEAEAEASGILSTHAGAAAVLLQPAQFAMTHLKIRRGDADADQALEKAVELIRQSKELQALGPVSIIRAEAAYLRGDLSSVAEELLPVYREATQKDPYVAATLGYWLLKADAISQPPEQEGNPFSLLIAGDWQGAAEMFDEIGRPYEQALALSEGDIGAQKKALRLFDQLGAAPAAGLLRARLRNENIKGIPRRPRPATRENPAGLTPRQLEVLACLVAGLSNQEIADQLYISHKTAGHHVSAILGKLEVASRQEAAQVALQEGWFLTDDGQANMHTEA